MLIYEEMLPARQKSRSHFHLVQCLSAATLAEGCQEGMQHVLYSDKDMTWGTEIVFSR
jgi:hypothetical protein